MSIRFLPALIPLLGFLALSLTACGGGSDENGSGAPPSTPTLGSRAMPGSTVTVTPEAAIHAGQETSLLIAAPDLPAGATVAAAIGLDRDTATALTLTALAANQWQTVVTLPDPLPAGTCVLVTLTLADGSVLESGYEDFVLAR